MKLIELISDITIERVLFDGRFEFGFDELEITDIFSDSKKVKKGSLFVCIAGTRDNGHKHIGEAVEKGASVILAEKGAEITFELSKPVRKNDRFFILTPRENESSE